jgi:hypothetical protein
VPSPPSPFSLCVYQSFPSGTEPPACPSGYPKETVIDSVLDDARKCTSCTCAPVPVSCDGGTAVFSPQCGPNSGPAIDVPTTACAQLDGGPVTTLDGGVGFPIISGMILQAPVPTDPTTSSCAADGGVAFGEVTVTTVTMICCM